MCGASSHFPNPSHKDGETGKQQSPTGINLNSKGNKKGEHTSVEKWGGSAQSPCMSFNCIAPVFIVNTGTEGPITILLLQLANILSKPRDTLDFWCPRSNHPLTRRGCSVAPSGHLFSHPARVPSGFCYSSGPEHHAGGVPTKVALSQPPHIGLARVSRENGLRDEEGRGRQGEGTPQTDVNAKQGQKLPKQHSWAVTPLKSLKNSQRKIRIVGEDLLLMIISLHLRYTITKHNNVLYGYKRAVP